MPTTGWTITLKPANPQGTNPRVLLLRKTVTPRQHTALELGGLYWHLVDAIWIFLWPMLYLTG